VNRRRTVHQGGIDWLVVFIVTTIALAVATVVSVIVWAIWFEVNDPGHGQVTKKHYSPAYYYTSCSGTGSSTVCDAHYMPECFEIDYTDGHHDGDACVSPSEYDEYEVGSYYPRGWRP
jgi:hypothetical protein